MMEHFTKIVNGFAKCFILDVWQGSEYASEPDQSFKLVMSLGTMMYKKDKMWFRKIRTRKKPIFGHFSRSIGYSVLS